MRYQNGLPASQCLPFKGRELSLKIARCWFATPDNGQRGRDHSLLTVIGYLSVTMIADRSPEGER